MAAGVRRRAILGEHGSCDCERAAGQRRLRRENLGVVYRPAKGEGAWVRGCDGTVA